jgi:hypothetical protein
MRPFGFALAVAIALVGARAHADADTAPPAADPPPPDAALAPKRDAWADVRRPWLYTVDPSAPPPLRVLASVGAGYASMDRGAARPFAADVAHAGAVFDAGGEVGLLRVLSLEGHVLLAGASPQTNDAVAAGGMAGLTLHPLPASWPVQASVSSGYLRELGGDGGVWGRVVVAGGTGRLRFGGSALAEHVFATGRDPLDLMLTAGASVRLVPWGEVGVEYVVQDLEEAADGEDVDGGMRHFIGLTASLLPTKHLQITAGPALGLSRGAPGVLGRGQVAYYF